MRDAMDDLVGIMEQIAGGEYGNEVFRYSTGEHPEMVRRIAEAIGMMMVKVEAREQRILMDLEEIRERHELFKKAVTTFVLTMSSAIGARDAYTQGHEQRTAGYALRLARRVGLSREDAQFVYLGSMLHDIGKLGFSDTLFSGEDCSDSPEMLQEIKAHPEIGSSILHWLDFLGPALDVVLYHHERMDGSGYPRGLVGEDIPYFARIAAVADTFDAITTDRPYKRGKTMREGLDILEAIAGSKLDPVLVAAFQEEVQENGLE